MKLYCLSNDPNKPCNVLTFKEITLMLDCGLSMKSILNFLPLSFVSSNRFLNLPIWMPNDVSDPELYGELRGNKESVFVDSPPEFCSPLDKLIDFSQIDAIVISNYLCMMALPFITEGTGFQGHVYATGPTLDIGRFLLEELVEHIELCPKANFAKSWKNHLQSLPYPLNESFEAKSWKQIYSTGTVNASLSQVRMVGYNEDINVYGALKLHCTSSGYNLGSSNWVITSEHEKIVYLSGSSTLTTHPKSMDLQALKNADVLILTDLTQAPISSPDAMLGLLCGVVALTIRGGGNALIPCYPSGIIYDLFECLTAKLQDTGVNCPMFFVSPVADMSLSYSNILAEWLSPDKQNRVYAPEEPFPHAAMLRNLRLQHFKHIHSKDFNGAFTEPCVVFCGHPSLRFGDVVQFVEKWGNDPQNCIIFMEPDFDFNAALAPFQPIQMRVVHCVIDTSLNFSQANKLMEDLNPSILVVPECYTRPPVWAPSLTDLVIKNSTERTLIPYKWGEVINLPLKRKQGQVFLERNVLRKLAPVEVQNGVHFASLSGVFDMKDNVGTLKKLKQTDPLTLKSREERRYEWGSVDIPQFKVELEDMGITDYKEEKIVNGVVIYIPRKNVIVQFKNSSTHVLCDNNHLFRNALRQILMKCLRRF